VLAQLPHAMTIVEATEIQGAKRGIEKLFDEARRSGRSVDGSNRTRGGRTAARLALASSIRAANCVSEGGKRALGVLPMHL
jgi:hypothetical protein